LIETIKEEFNSRATIKVPKLRSYLKSRKDQKRFKWLSEVGMKHLTRDLDLAKFVHSQRESAASLGGLLDGAQQFFVQRFSRFVLDSSEDEDEDQELRAHSRAGTLKDDLRFLEKMTNSDSAVTKRLIKLFKISMLDQTTKEEMKKVKSVAKFKRRSNIFGVPNWQQQAIQAL